MVYSLPAIITNGFRLWNTKRTFWSAEASCSVQAWASSMPSGTPVFLDQISLMLLYVLVFLSSVQVWYLWLCCFCLVLLVVILENRIWHVGSHVVFFPFSVCWSDVRLISPVLEYLSSVFAGNHVYDGPVSLKRFM